MRSIILVLKTADPTLPDSIRAVHDVRISRNLYALEKMYAFELAKEYSNPLSTNQKPTPVDESLCRAHDQFIPKRKMTLIFRSSV